MSPAAKSADGASDLPELGYYTDANGLTWQLSAEDAQRLGYTAADKPDARSSPAKPAGPAAEGAPAPQ